MDIIKITGIGYDSNVYLINEGESAHLIDTGTGEHTGYILGKIQENISGQKIKSTILTHEHFDHTGGLVQLAEIAPQAHVMMHKKCKDALEAKMDKLISVVENALIPAVKQDKIFALDGKQFAVATAVSRS